MESDNDSELYSSDDQSESEMDEQGETTNENEQMLGKKRKHVEQYKTNKDLEEEEEDSNDEDVGDSDDNAQDFDEEENVSDEADSDIPDDKMSKRTKFDNDPRFQFTSDNLNKTGDGDEDSEGGEDSEVDKSDSQEVQSKSGKSKERKKLPKPGIIYLSRIPPLMKPKKLNIIFNQYGEVGRMFFQQEDKNFSKQRKKKGGNRARAYTEGWIEFKKKKIAKRVALTFNNTRVGVKKRSRYYDDLWNIKYLHRFQWAHLMERLEYEKQVRSQRVRTEVMQAKKETNFYLKNVEKQKVIERMQTKKSQKGKSWEFKGRNFKQWRTEEERAEDRRMLQEAMPQRSGKVTSSVLGKIFKK